MSLHHVLRTFGAAAWRFDARHYFPRVGKALTGAPVAAFWDPQLQNALLVGGYVLEEEAVAGALLEDLTC